MTGDTFITGIRSIGVPSRGVLIVTVGAGADSAALRSLAAAAGVAPAAGPTAAPRSVGEEPELVAVTVPNLSAGLLTLSTPAGPDQWADRPEPRRVRPLGCPGACNPTVHRPPRP